MLGLAKEKGARFLLAPTSEVYGDPLVNPQPEAITMAYHRYHRIDTRIVRIFNTYGTMMRINDGRVVPNFIGQALRGGVFRRSQAGAQKSRTMTGDQKVYILSLKI